MQWWRDARFGMFVHWGLYSGLAGEWEGKSLGSSGNMEWAQHRAKVDTDIYAKQAFPLFKPKPGFATEWVKLAKAAGCKYLVFTTKHHEGFALHDSKVSDFDAGSVLHRDLVDEIVKACRVEGLKIGFYHSVIDWHHDQFAYAESESIPHPLRGKPYPNGQRDQNKYIEYLHAQVNELINNYGPIDIMWWDYSVPDFQGEKAWQAPKLIEMVKQCQPSVIMNNRLYRLPEAGHSGTAQISAQARLDPEYGDFMTPEQHVPDTGMPNVDWETCMTMNTTWGYSKHDHNWKSTETLLHTLVDVVSKGGNLLLNVGPQADGTIPDESVKALREIGQWLNVNGEAIYGASASPIDKPTWGRLTQKPAQGVVYLHIFDWPESGKLEVTGLSADYLKAYALGSLREVPLIQEGAKLILDVSGIEQEPLVTVIHLQRLEKSDSEESATAGGMEKDKRLHSDGSPWGLRQPKITDPTLPRVLLIGDSILNGYLSFVTDALKGEANVDAWVNPYFQSEQMNKALAEILAAGPYDVVHFNVGLHGWQKGRIKPGTFKPLTRAFVEIIRQKCPHAKLFWASSTPVTVKGNPADLDAEINPVILEHNRMAAEVMTQMNVPINDFYGLLVEKRELARGDRFHWTPPAYDLLGRQAAEMIHTALKTRETVQAQ